MEEVAQSKFDPEDRAKAERMGPVVMSYRTREIDRDEYERR